LGHLKVRDAIYLIELVQVIGLDSRVQEAFKQLLQHQIAVIDPSKKNTLIEHGYPCPLQSPTTGQGLFGELSRMVEVRNQPDREAARRQNPNQLVADTLRQHDRISTVNPQPTQMPNRCELVEESGQRVLRHAQGIATRENHLSDRWVLSNHIQGMPHAGSSVG